MTVYANGRSLVYAGDGEIDVSATPDVCKTPSPGGPVPVPYVNVARSSDLKNGSKTVEVDGHPVALQDSYLATSTGDEPGTAGGLISSKTKGKLTWSSYSLDVRYEGKGAVRFLDTTQHNGNTGNCVGFQNGHPEIIWAYGDDPVDGQDCPRCQEAKETHKVPETSESRALASALVGMLEVVRTRMSHIPTLKKGKGYMVGVLFCKGYPNGGVLYAARSGDRECGTKEQDGFTLAVELLKRENAKWTLCGGARIDFSKAMDCKGSKPGEAFFSGLEDKLKQLELEKPELVVIDERGKRRPLPRPDPGNCAAPKLIQAALSEGHYPLSMTEMYYSPTKPETVKTLVTYSGNPVLTAAPRQELKTFKHGDVVPSCVTCQVILTPMLCGNGEAQCP